MASFPGLAISLKERNAHWAADMAMALADSQKNTCGGGVGPSPAHLAGSGRQTLSSEADVVL